MNLGEILLILEIGFHYLFGKRYRLELVLKAAPPEVRLKGKTKIVLQVRPGSAGAKRREVMAAWQRRQLQPLAENVIMKWQDEIGVTATSWGIRQMKTRWGSCNEKRAHVWINLELAKKPLACLEYIVVHELLHLIEKKHNDRFVELMTRHLPKWRSVKAELTSFILSHEKWE